MHYVVTGGAGFIGHHLCKQLRAEGHDVSIIDNFSSGKKANILPDCAVIEGDAANPDTVSDAVNCCDGVFHLAAIASVDMSRTHWRSTTHANLMATVTMLDAISTRLKPVPFVYASSAAIYGDNDNLPLAESETPRPLTAYGADKLASEYHARVGTLIHHIPTAGMRFFNIYGERQDPHSPYSGVISIFANKLLAGEAVAINGDGGQSRDFVYVGDVVKHLIAAMQRSHGDTSPQSYIFNVCRNQSVTITELATILAELTNNNTPATYSPARSGDIYRSLGNNKYASSILECRADTELKDGLTRTLTWLKNA
jgi:UDP-glucose 4-epimerase